MELQEFVILIADEDEKIVTDLKDSADINKKDFKIKIARNGKEAIKFIENDRIDLMLLNMEISNISGREVLFELNEKKIWLPVIALITRYQDEKQDVFQNFGIVDYFYKPFELNKLVLKIEEVFSSNILSDSIAGMDFTTVLQIVEMERKTGIITIKNNNEYIGRIFFDKGMFIDIEANGFSTDDILNKYINKSPFQKNKVLIQYLKHNRKAKINKSLSEILLNTLRINDESNNENEEIKEMKNKSNQKKRILPNCKKLISILKEELGDAVISTEIWEVSSGEVLDSFNAKIEVCDLFTEITAYIHEVLSASDFPHLNDYYLLDLEDNMIKVIISIKDYLWGILIDSKKTTLGFLLRIVLSNLISTFNSSLSEKK